MIAFTWLFSKRECFNFSSCNCKINMNKNNVKYSQSFNFSQLTLVEKTEIKNFCHATPDLVIS